MIERCVLCESTDLKLVQDISKKDLENLYFENFHFDISEYLVKDTIKHYKCNKCKLSFFDPSTAGNGKFYEELQEKRNQYYNPNRKEFLFAQKFINPKDSVLEIGAGYGYFSKLLTTDRYLGLEFNDKAIEVANSGGINLIKEDIIELSSKNIEPFDVVCSFHVLEHVQSLNKFLEASLKVLKDDGVLIIAIPCNDSILTSNHNHVLNMPPHHINRFYIETMHYFEKIFNLKLIDFKLDSVWERIPHMDYVTSVITKKILDMFFPSQNIVVSTNVYKRTQKIVHVLNKKFRLYKLFKITPIPENMTFAFKKIVS
jgi:2-polyprenyl-3-methyl-5-hydroxy-6-metoxy-1,4-benzoquinol methylase